MKRFIQNNYKHTPGTIFIRLMFLTLTLGFASRVIFFLLTGDSICPTVILAGLARGVLFDFAVALYISIPFALLGLLPLQFWQKGVTQRIVFILFYVLSFSIAFISLCEFFFVREFNSRFNFIAVDYLVYTNEVVKNLWESYPVSWFLLCILIVHFVLIRFLFTTIKFKRAVKNSRVKAVAVLVLGIICFLLISESQILDGVPSAEAELSKNPVHALFAAYRSNEIDFKRFYSSMEKSRAAEIVHEAFEMDTPGFSENEGVLEDETSIVRNIVRDGPEKKMNVVVVLMESMSARFMNSFGSKRDLTPNLDRLAREGLFFDHVYSTGTRTVRGIEAVVLSIPPTPGQSIVRRPEAGSIFNIGSVFRSKGYSTQFLYGGHSFFDNMGNFFSSNGFDVLDQSSMAAEEIHFSNAWGVCDEDLFQNALKNADLLSEKPFFQIILTTSNHRPYTYPDGRIDIASHTGRDGAVKYADYAIGKYMEGASHRPWYKNTIFVFVADHNASVAGGTKILPYDYKIPLIYFAPGHIKPEVRSMLGSQIDLAPTLLSLLNFSYQSRFFGHDLMHSQTERAFLATYQVVGLWRPGKMVLLYPNRRISIYKMDAENEQLQEEIHAVVNQNFSDEQVEETIGFYEAASDWFSDKLLKEQSVFDTRSNTRRF